tara:strand:+ start:367 stop:1890 length:1524 start_codon:yes stop_codon:yes gene_type:complete
MPIQQMLLGAGGKLKPGMEFRVWQANSGNGSDATMIANSTSNNFWALSDGRVVISGNGEDWTDVRSGSGQTLGWMVTSTDTKTIAKSRYLWGSTSQGEQRGIYPYRGPKSSSTDLFITPIYGYYYVYSGSARKNYLYIQILDSLANDLAILKRWRWNYQSYYTMSSIYFYTKDGTDDDYVTVFQDYASSGRSGQNVRIQNMNITSSSISISNTRYIGGSNNNGTTLASCTSDSSGNVYINGNTQEFTSPTRYIIIKANPSSGIIWERNYHQGSSSAYGSAVCEVDSNGNVYTSQTWGGQSTTSPANGYKCGLMKHNSSGTLQWAVSWNTVDAYMDGSVMINDKLYILVRYRPGSDNWSVVRPIIAEIDISDGSINWQNKIDYTDDRFKYYFGQNQGRYMRADKDNNLAIMFRYFEDTDGSSIITKYGTAFATGIDSSGGVGDGTIGSLMSYTSTNLMSLTDCSSELTSNTDELVEGTFTVGNINNNTSSEFNTATTANQTLTNMNDQ